MNKHLTPIGMSLVALCIVTVIAVTGQMSYEDEVREHDYHCDMIKSGAWPANKSIKCEGE